MNEGKPSYKRRFFVCYLIFPFKRDYDIVTVFGKRGEKNEKNS